MTTDRYEPASDFLKAVAFGDAALCGNAFADMNRHAVLALMRDEDETNRDWATFLIAQLDLDTPEIRDALLLAAKDRNEDVRGEALLGLAQRDRFLALPLLKLELAKEAVNINTVEAAEVVADASLVELLASLRSLPGDPHFNKQVQSALVACSGDSPLSAREPGESLPRT